MSHHLLKRLLFTLRLPCQFGAAMTEACYVLLHVGYLVLLPLVLLHLCILHFRSCVQVGVVIACKQHAKEISLLNFNDY